MKFQRPVAAIVSAMLIASCRAWEQEQTSSDLPASENAPTELPAIPAAEPSLDRAALLLAVARAASATAIGADDRVRQRELDGKQFEMRIRFGCKGAVDEQQTASRRWMFDEKTRVIRFRVNPDFSGSSQMVETIIGREFEAAEGFWLKQPWVLTAGCLRIDRQEPDVPGADQSLNQSTEAEPVTTEVPAWRVGIAQFFTETDPRTRRRDDRAYEATRQLARDEAPSMGGYDLVLSGRLKQLPGEKVISCALQREDRPPACIISAEFNRVRIEQPPSNKILAEWGSG